MSVSDVSARNGRHQKPHSTFRKDGLKTSPGDQTGLGTTRDETWEACPVHKICSKSQRDDLSAGVPRSVAVSQVKEKIKTKKMEGCEGRG